jgi:hypothetical protein
LAELGAVEDERWEDEAVHSVWGEENETDKWITEEVKARIGRRFWSSVGEGFSAFLGGWRPRIEMGHHIDALLESAITDWLAPTL